MPKIEAIQNIDIYEIWNAQTSGIQHIINTELQNQALTAMEATLPITSAEFPNARRSQLSYNDKMEITQHIQNMNTVSSAWLQSNPIDINSHMDNSSFIISTFDENKFPIETLSQGLTVQAQPGKITNFVFEPSSQNGVR